MLDVVFPRRCAGCGNGAWPFCNDCRSDLVALAPPWCTRCGRPFELPVDRCRECPPPVIGTTRAPFLYEGAARSAVHRLKFSGWRTVAEALARAMASVAEYRADAVCWVPLSRSRLSERGYDQARALAVEVGRRLGFPVRSLLARVSETEPQARRTGADRRLAMRGVFRVVGRLPPSSVLLVDDVLTTGATAAACARALIDAGAREVGLLTATRAVSGALPRRCYTRPGSRLGLWLPGGSSPVVDASRRRSDPRKATFGC